MAFNSASTFNTNPRRQQELVMRPLANRIYSRVFNIRLADIQRFDNELDERHLLDRQHGIDVRLTTPSGLVITGQEKFLSAKFARFNSLTVEYEQNQHTGERGDWFKLACQFYFVGYATVDWTCFTSWIIVDWLAIVLATAKGAVRWHQNANHDGRARASFRYVRFEEIPNECILSKGGCDG